MYIIAFLLKIIKIYVMLILIVTVVANSFLFHTIFMYLNLLKIN